MIYLYRMIPTDIIAYISDYTKYHNFRLLDREINEKIYLNESSKNWYQKYESYFMKNNMKIPRLKYTNINWKREYCRVIDFESWDSFKDITYDTKKNYRNHYQKRVRQIIKGIPKEIGILIKMEEIFLDINEIKEIPNEIGNCINLRSIQVAMNLIKKIPTEIGKLVKLQEFSISYNQIKEIPIEIGKLVNLRKFGFGHNKIKKIPQEIGKCILLTNLWINNNQISELPIEMGNCTVLSDLWLENNNISEIPTEIKNISGLRLMWHTKEGELKVNLSLR